MLRKFFKKFKYGEKGFTLIELLVVVAILGILAAVAIPNVTKFVNSGNIAAANTEVATVQTAALAYASDNQTQLSAAGAGNVAFTAGNDNGAYSGTLDNYLDKPLKGYYQFDMTGKLMDGSTSLDPIYPGLKWNETSKQFGP